MLALETLGQRRKWEKTKVWRFFRKFTSYYSLHKLPGSFGTDNERVNRFVTWKSRRVLQAMEDTHNREAILEKTEESSDFRD